MQKRKKMKEKHDGAEAEWKKQKKRRRKMEGWNEKDQAKLVFPSQEQHIESHWKRKQEKRRRKE